MDWQGKLQQAYEIIGGEETGKRELLRLSYEVKKEVGNKGLKEFSDDLKGTYGVTRSPGTLRQYAYVYEGILKYDIPEDISYSTIRAIITSENPEKYVKLIDQGFTSGEIFRQIKEDKPKKEVVNKCKLCGKEIVCSCQEESH